MRIRTALVLFLFATNLYAGKPADPPSSDSANFVGYSSGTLTEGQYVDDLWVEAAGLCKETYGEAAYAATEVHIKQAINDGTFFPPSAPEYGYFLPSNAVPGYASSNWGRIESYGGFREQDRMPTGGYVLRMACVN